jgi:xanthine dehydrogenase accessory factor
MRLNDWKAVVQCLARGERVFLCLVVEATKGSPGTPGAALALGESGHPIGTIGGGGMERDLLLEARAALEKQGYIPRCETLYHHSRAPGRESGLICGGSQTHVSLCLEPAKDFLAVKAISEKLRAEKGGGLEISPAGLRFIAEVETEFPSFALQREGDTWCFQQRLRNPRRVAIMGGGHCGVALAQTMRGLGYSAQVFETRPNLYTLAQFPEREVELVKNFSDAGELVHLPEVTFAVVMTSGYPGDVDALTGLLPFSFPFIGLMGARSKIRRIREALTMRGFSEQDWARITAPVGLPLDSDTPEEIAVSVAAQILLKRKELNLD